MSLDHKNRLFETRYNSKYENTFEAVKHWYDDAQRLKRISNNKLSNSEALNAALTGKLPQNYISRRSIDLAESEYIDRYIREAVSQIDSIDIQKSVLVSMNISRKNRKLIFAYSSKLTSSEKSRVRIIDRLIWYNLFPLNSN